MHAYVFFHACVTCVNVTCDNVTCVNVTCVNVTCVNVTCVNVTCVNVTCVNVTCVNVTCVNVSSGVLTFVLPSDAPMPQFIQQRCTVRSRLWHWYRW